MGIFSFLFGGKTSKQKANKTPAERNEPAVKAAPPAMASAAETGAPVIVSVGATQARLRLKFAASMRTGQHAAAYEAARELADIQVRAGRRTVARGWQKEADRIKEQAGLSQ